MKRLKFMVIAGEASGDTLAAELVRALREELANFQSRSTEDVQPLFASLEPEFFGAGGAKLAAEGVKLEVDMTAHAVFGLLDVVRNLGRLVRLRDQLKDLAIARQPDVILCVDYSGFNLRLARAVKEHVRAGRGTFNDWNPRIVQFVSPQVWASRPGRAQAMARDLDLVLSIFPFEKAWYAERVPQLRVEFVGHPLLDRYPGAARQSRGAGLQTCCIAGVPVGSKPGTGAPAGLETRDTAGSEVRATTNAPGKAPPSVILLPGSRAKELKRHLPILLQAARKIEEVHPATWRMVLPGEELARSARPMLPAQPRIALQVGGLDTALAQADLALASSGTVTMECAFFGVPTVVLYKVSPLEYQVARRMLQVKHIAMPNLLAGEMVFPEFVQHEATPANLARAALEFLDQPERRTQVRAQLDRVIASLGGPGAATRAACAIVKLLENPASQPGR